MNLLSQTFRRLSTVCLLALLLGGFGDQAKAQVVTGVQPVSGSIDVPLNSSIVFTFDVPLFPIPFGAVVWSANIDTVKMSYSWSVNNTVLTCQYEGNLPGSSLVTWEINPESSPLLFDAVNFVPIPNTVGSFTTVEGSDCNPDGVPDSFGRLFLSKNLRYVQTSASAPVVDSEFPAVFSAMVQSPVVDPVSDASLKLPDSSTQELTPVGVGRFSLFGPFDSQAEMDASTAYPAGNYEMTMTRTTSPDTVVNLAVPSSYPPVPTVANFPEAQAVNPAIDFTLEWGAFSGATSSDIIVLSIDDGNTTVFEAPDLCVPIELPNTSISMVIPAGTLEAAKTYTGTLSFYRSFYYSTNDPAGFLTSGALVKSTRFDINTGDTVVVPEPQLSAPTFTPGGLFTFMAGNLEIGTTYRVERSTTLLPDSWTFMEQIAATAASQPIMDNDSSESTGQRFYRIITP